MAALRPLVRLPDLSSLSAPRRSRECVFSVAISKGDALRVDIEWKALPRECEGICERELALLAVAAMSASTFRDPLDLAISAGRVSATVSAAASIEGLEFRPFTFEDPAVHASMHGRWRASSAQKTRCGDTTCTVRHVVLFRHELGKLKFT